MQSAIHEVKAAPTFKLQHPELTMPQFITHGQPDHFPDESYKPLEFKVTQLQLAEFLAHSQPVTAGLSHLFSCCTFAHMVDTPGLTWYELYLLAAACTPQPRSLISSTSAQPAKNITFLREFAVETMRLVKFAIQTQCHPYFLASQSLHNKMQAYGVWNRPQHTSIMIQLDSGVFAALDEALLNMTSKLTKNQRDSLTAASQRLNVPLSWMLLPRHYRICKYCALLNGPNLPLKRIDISVQLVTQNLRPCLFL